MEDLQTATPARASLFPLLPTIRPMAFDQWPNKMAPESLDATPSARRLQGAERMAIVERQEKVAARCCSSGLAPKLHNGINLPQARTVSQDDQEVAPHVPHPGARQPRSPLEEGSQQSTPGLD